MLWQIILQALAWTPQRPLQAPDAVFSVASPADAFRKHAIYKLNDGRFIPSPAFGAGSVNKGHGMEELIELALQAGFRHFDNARYYANEASVGRALQKSGLKREEIYLTTKYDGLNGEDVETELRKQLQDLQVASVDLYLIHFPALANRTGGIEPLWRQFERVKEQGLTKSIGVSNYPQDLLQELLDIARIKPAVNQIQLHAYNALENRGVIELAAEHGIVTEAFSSLAPITQFPGGEADVIGKRIADRLSEETGTHVTVGQAIADWLKTRRIVEVTTSSQLFRMKEQLRVFEPDFPPLTPEEVDLYEHSRLSLKKLGE